MFLCGWLLWVGESPCSPAPKMTGWVTYHLVACIHSFIFSVTTIMKMASMDSASACYSVSIRAMLTWKVLISTLQLESRLGVSRQDSLSQWVRRSSGLIAQASWPLSLSSFFQKVTSTYFQLLLSRPTEAQRWVTVSAFAFHLHPRTEAHLVLPDNKGIIQ